MAPEAAPSLTPGRRAERIKARARELGFADVGITDLRPVPHARELDRWLASGRAGTMRYLHRQAPRRKAPAGILSGATRAIVVIYNYYPAQSDSKQGWGRVARYAWGADYHTALTPALEKLAEFTRSLGPPGSMARCFVDAGPVPERELAQRAGLGWIAKNTMLIHPELGSFTFIATILTDVDLGLDPPFAPDRCGSCTRCLEACPTDAFPEPRVLDARRCIAYLTIEHRGEIPPHLAAPMGDRVFGCDICQDVCPWNGKFATVNRVPVVELHAHHAWVHLDAFATLDDTGFEQRYGWTPLQRAGLPGMRRNAAIAARNVYARNACQIP